MSYALRVAPDGVLEIYETNGADRVTLADSLTLTEAFELARLAAGWQEDGFGRSREDRGFRGGRGTDLVVHSGCWGRSWRLLTSARLSLLTVRPGRCILQLDRRENQ